MKSIIIILLAQLVLSASLELVQAQNLGFSPQAKLLLGNDGNFYGENTSGGTFNNGTIFKMTPSGQVNLFYTFTNTDGSAPIGGLIQGSDGNFYGVTSGALSVLSGGTTGGVVNEGTIFRLTPAGILTTLVTFNGTNGAYPNGIIQASNGVIYGTTIQGGISNAGTLFSLTLAGTFSTLVNFNSLNVAYPSGLLVQGPDSNLYGTVDVGPGGQGAGALYKIAPGGTTPTIIHDFLGGSDTGANPIGSLVFDASGNLYGVTSAGGATIGGTIFELSNNGTYSTLIYPLSDGTTNYLYANGPLTLDSSGNIYGTTLQEAGTGSSDGIVFTFLPHSGESGLTLTVLHHFSMGAGDYCKAGLIEDSSGTFYGTTGENGVNGGGTVFKITTSGVYTTLFSFSPTPIIKSQPTPETVAVGQPVTFSATIITPTYPGTVNTDLPITPNYPLSYQWQRNGVNIAGATGATYTITSPNSSDASYVYSVIATNQVGSVTSTSASLTLTNAPVIAVQPAPQMVNEFQQATFTVSSYGLAPFSYQWQRAPSGSSTFTNLSNGGLYSGATSASLSVTPESLSESGDQFQCVVTNSSGSATSNPASLTVEELGQTILVGQPASFTVTPSGTGPFTYQWQFNGANISGAINATYSIPATTLANSGTYTVLVTGGTGGFTATYALSVVTSLPQAASEPTMPEWMLILMAGLLAFFATRKRTRVAG